MATTYEIFHSVRLTGRINANGDLEIITKRATEVVEALLIKSDAPPKVRVELYDFAQNTAAGVTTWQFVAAAPWRRDRSPYVWAEFKEFSDGEAFHRLNIAARPEGNSTQEKPKQIYIKIEPVVDAPDKS